MNGQDRMNYIILHLTFHVTCGITKWAGCDLLKNDLECRYFRYLWQITLYRNVYHKWVLMFGVARTTARSFQTFNRSLWCALVTHHRNKSTLLFIGFISKQWIQHQPQQTVLKCQKVVLVFASPYLPIGLSNCHNIYFLVISLTQ